MTRVGHWRSRQGAEAYARAYDAIMAALPEPDAVLDVPNPYGTSRVLRWDGPQPGPPVVLLPGRSSGAPMWQDNLPDWVGRRTLYALDPLGDAGMSSQRVPLARFEDQAEWIAETLTGLGIDGAHVVGHSFGAANAAILAVVHPERVATLALLEPVFVVRPVAWSAFFWATVTVLPVPQAWKDRALAELGGVTVEEVREASAMSSLIDAAATHYAAALPVPRTLRDPEWRSLTMPVRVDIAGRQSVAGGGRAADRLRHLLPDATVTVWPNATHSLPMQERAALGPLLERFWAGHG